MYTCHDIPDIFGDELLSETGFAPVISTEFYNRFEIIDELGRGADSIIYRVIDKETNEVLALKNAWSIYELAIQCTLSSNRDYTESIQPIRTWARVNDNIMFTSPILHQPLSEDFLRQISDLDILSIFFEILIAVIVMNQQQIFHNDLDFNNIMIRNSSMLRVYTLNGIRYIINCPYLPVIIDFGEAFIPEIQRKLFIRDLLPGFPAEMRDMALASVMTDEYLTRDTNTDWERIQTVIITTLNQIHPSLNIPTGGDFRTLLLSPLFAFLIDNPINEGDTVKYFKELTLA